MFQVNSPYSLPSQNPPNVTNGVVSAILIFSKTQFLLFLAFAVAVLTHWGRNESKNCEKIYKHFIYHELNSFQYPTRS